MCVCVCVCESVCGVSMCVCGVSMSVCESGVWCECGVSMSVCVWCEYEVWVVCVSVSE